MWIIRKTGCYVETQRFSENYGKLALCNKPLYKSDKQINFAFSF